MRMQRSPEHLGINAADPIRPITQHQAVLSLLLALEGSQPARCTPLVSTKGACLLSDLPAQHSSTQHAASDAAGSADDSWFPFQTRNVPVGQHVDPFAMQVSSTPLLCSSSMSALDPARDALGHIDGSLHANGFLSSTVQGLGMDAGLAPWASGKHALQLGWHTPSSSLLTASALLEQGSGHSSASVPDSMALALPAPKWAAGVDAALGAPVLNGQGSKQLAVVSSSGREGGAKPNSGDDSMAVHVVLMALNGVVSAFQMLTFGMVRWVRLETP